MAKRDVPNSSDMDYDDEIINNVRICSIISLSPERFQADMRHVDIGDGVQLSAIAWGGPVALETEPLLARYLVTAPLAGEITIGSGEDNVVADTEHAAIIDPRAKTEQRWSTDAAAIWLHLSRECVENEARHLLRAQERSVTLPARRPVRFSPTIELTHGAAQRWHATLRRLVDLLDDYEPGRIPPHRLAVLRRDVTAGLLRAAWRSRPDH